MKKNILLLMLLVANGIFAQSAGFNTTYIVLSINGGANTFYDLQAVTSNPDFNGADLGTFCQGATTGIVFKGAEHNVFKCGGCDLTSTRIYYRIYPTGNPSGSFVSNTIGFTSDFDNGCGGKDQKWSNVGYSTNLLSGLGAGNYTIDVYSDASTTCFGTVYASNNSANYKATFTINATSAGGSISGTQAVCSGGMPTDLTLSGHTGSVTKWQRSTSSDFTSGVTDISNTTTTLSGSSIGTLTTTTYFRAVVTSGVCSSANSSVATVIVNPASVGGSVSGNQAVCSGSIPADLTLSGHTGSVTKWQRSTSSDFTSGVTDISNTTTTLSGASIGALTTTTYFRAVVTSGVCSSANSSAATITVNPETVGGTLSGNYEFCSVVNSGTLTLSGHTGNIIKWQSSPASDFGSDVTDISNTTATLNFNDVTQTTYYRAIVKSGNCSEASSASGAVLISSNVWTGEAGNSNWNDENNWSCGVVPAQAQAAVISAGENQPEITGDITVASLTIGADAALVVQSGSNLTVIDEVVIDETGSLTIENNANLIQVNDVDNTGNIIVYKNSAPMFRLDYAMWSSPVAGETLIGFSPETLSNRFYRYNTLTDAYAVIEGGNVPFGEGMGYLIRVANNHPAIYIDENSVPQQWTGFFTGVPNNGDVDVPTIPFEDNDGGDNDISGYNAIGNPYPSPINIHAFYEANEGSIDPLSALYFWRKKNEAGTSSYAKVTKLAYTANTQDFTDSSAEAFSGPNDEWVINPGQGFIVRALQNTIHFNNQMRVPVNNNQQFRTSQDDDEAAMSRLWLNLSGAGTAFSQAAIGYTDITTNGIDYGWDGSAFTDGDIAIFSYIGDSKLSIQARASFENSDEVPMGYKAATAGTYTISLDHMDGVFAQDQDIYLKDNLLGITHDLKQGAYQFATEAGTFAGRFDILYTNEVLGANNPAPDANSIIVYKQGSSIAINSGAIDMTAVSIYDIRGRLLYNDSNINTSETVINSLQAQQQVLIVQVATSKGKINKKLVY